LERADFALKHFVIPAAAPGSIEERRIPTMDPGSARLCRLSGMTVWFGENPAGSKQTSMKCLSVVPGLASVARDDHVFR
jgi:hypothetical protein